MDTWIVLCVCALLGSVVALPPPNPDFKPELRDNGTADGMERWGYADIREGAHLFWWLYYTYHNDTYLNRPWIIWLQGGPGGSSTGFGNFELMGPLNQTLHPNDETWVNEVSVVFLDQPVGTGYSYADGPEYFTTTNLELALDMVEWIKLFLTNYPDFQTIPLYIFGESYGGKMGTEFAYELYNAIGRGEVTVNFQGLANGDAWHSAADSIIEWGNHLYYMSNLDDPGLARVSSSAQLVKQAADAGDWLGAQAALEATELIVSEETNGIAFGHILRYDGDQPGIMEHRLPPSKAGKQIKTSPVLYNVHLAPFEADPMDDLMNGPIRDKLGIIPTNVTWGAQSDEVFDYLLGDFMKPVVQKLDQILIETTLKLNIYQGSLDLVCLTKGAMDVVNQLTWPGLPDYQNANKTAFTDPDIPGQTELFVKPYNNFKFYWLINAGHKVPKDYPTAARRMLVRIVFDMDR